MPGSGQTDIVFGGFQRAFTGNHVRIVRQSVIDQLFGRFAGFTDRLEIVRQTFDAGLRKRAGDFQQGFARIDQRIAGQNGVGTRGIVTGAGFMHVGDRGETDFQALFGLIELTLDRAFFGTRCRQAVDGSQHIEVGFRDADDQAVVGRIQFRIRLQGAGFAARKPGIVAVVVNALAQAGAVLLLGARTAEGGVVVQCAIGIVLVQAHSSVDLRQQIGTRLHHALLGDGVLRFTDGQRWVALARLGVGLDQINGEGRRRTQCQRGGQSQGGRFETHAEFLHQREKRSTGWAPVR